MTIRAKWRVVGGILKEEMEIEAGFFVKKMMKGPVEKIAPEQHRKFFAEAGKV